MGGFPIQYSYGLLGNAHQVRLCFAQEGLPAPVTVDPGMPNQHEEILLSKDSNLRVRYLGLCRKQELETNRNLSTLCLGGKHIELFGGCFQVSPRCIHLSFLDHRHHLDTG